MRATHLLPVLLCAAACGGGGDGTPDGGYPGTCGPVKTDAGRPNTLLATIDRDTTLTKACSPYYFEGNTVIAATVTIEPGVKLIGPQGGARSRITVNRAGKLLATGTPTEPIVFTTLCAETGCPGGLGGQWTGILFLEGRPNSHLEHVIIEYAGGPYMRMPGDDEFGVYEFPRDGSLLNDSTPDLEVADVWIRKSNGYAVAATTNELFDTDGKSIYALFDRVTFTDNLATAWLPVNQIGALGPDLCWQARDAMGLCPAGGAPPANHYLEAHIDQELGRTPENVTKDATWKPYPIPYKVENVNIAGGALLEILDGVELRLVPTASISVGLSGPGALKMVAATPGGIKVTSFRTVPPDYHRGIRIWDMADETRTEITNVDIGYGGAQSPIVTEAPADLAIYDVNPTIIGNHVHHSLGMGIHWNCTADPKGLEDPPLPSTNTSDDATIRCAMPGFVGVGIAQNFGCDCAVSTNCMDRCPQP